MLQQSGDSEGHQQRIPDLCTGDCKVSGADFFYRITMYVPAYLKHHLLVTDETDKQSSCHWHASNNPFRHLNAVIIDL